MSSVPLSLTTLPDNGMSVHGTTAPDPQEDSNLSTARAIAILKRRIAELEFEKEQILSKVARKPVQSLTREGRAVRRLVAFVEPIADMISESDRRQLRLADGISAETIQTQSSPDQDQTHGNFKKLLRWCPTIGKLMVAGELDLHVIREVQAGADGARGDDASRLKGEVIHWINMTYRPIGEQLLCAREKGSRGLAHNLTGELLCPVEYDWNDTTVRCRIREHHPDFQVTAFSWPRFLYKDAAYNPNEPSKGLFQGDLLLKAFKCIFTSPKSARSTAARGKSVGRSARTRSNVATILGMKAVDPRAIAYIAAQVRFALSEVESWAPVDERFHYEVFYYHVIEHFEAPASPEKAAEIQELLLWWNTKVFGNRAAGDYRPLQVETLSVARSRK